ncbi:MAG: xylanase [Spirochaetales bacterium]|nr:xylanase [Spirochaetales bacterium]
MEQRTYRNVFSELGYRQAEIDKKIHDSWLTIFEGPESERFYFDAPDNTGYMADTGNHDVRTEGMSYGMMMAVQMDRQDIFDRLWKWSLDHMYIIEGILAGYFAWSCQYDGTRNYEGPAPDGEEYYALALFFASHRWGDREAPFNYETQAWDLLRTCIHKGENGEGAPMWSPENHLIKFVPNCEFTDPSYHLPHFYELFAEWARPEDRAFWKKAAEASRAFIPESCHPVTGMAPEYSEYDGTAITRFRDCEFYSDSYRVASNLGLDASWFGPRPWQKAIADNIQSFFVDIPTEDFKSYMIDGTPLDQPALHPVGLLATNAQAALATSGPVAERTVRRFWDTPLRTGDRRYYDNCLYFFALLALSGNYRIY